MCAKLWAEHCTRQLLHHVAEGDEEACLGDIRNGANVNAVGPEKQTALMAAQQKRMEKVCGLDTRRRPRRSLPPPSPRPSLCVAARRKGWAPEVRPLPPPPSHGPPP